MSARGTAVSLLVASLAAIVTVGAGASVGASTTIDRTFSCKVGIKGGITRLDVNGRTGFKKAGKFEWLAQVGVSTWKLGKPLPYSLAGITAGWPPPSPDLVGGLGVDSMLCKPVRTRVPLTKRGLVGGPAGYFGDDYKCFTPRTVLVRLRAELAEPATLVKMKGGGLNAIVRVRKGELAVATPKGKPIVYGVVRDSGKAQLYIARGCL